MVSASTAAGPAFEGAKISMGMRAATGAISEVQWNRDQLECAVIGGTAARGICGSGLVDAVAAGLNRGLIEPGGRYADGRAAWPLSPPVALTQRDIRELQLAKGAIVTGLVLLAKELNLSVEDLEHVYLAGAFGNYLNQASAERVGLLPVRRERVISAGNTALLGAKRALFDARDEIAEIIRRIEHISLNELPDFQETFVEQLRFPA
jgi:uncharacterized 2Fe-2S/4Fe-4S cluster protein (DUF4445 family)